MFTSRLPLVSAICCTHGRPRALERAIACFQAQTYPRKELVVAYPSDDSATRAVLERHDTGGRVRGAPFEPAAVPTRGEARNRAIDESRGEYVCTWEDEDWHHAERMRLQVSAIHRTHQVGALLTNVLLFDDAAGEAYFSHFRLWEPTLLVRRDVLGGRVRYPALDQLEDTYLVKLLMTVSHVIPVVAPGLYVRALSAGAAAPSALFVRAAQPLCAATSKLVSEIVAGRRDPCQASDLLTSRALLAEYKYFYFNNVTGTQRHIAEYCAAVASGD